MGHIPDDDSLDEFMDASAEEWSKPEQAPKVPESAPEPADRWGSSTADKSVVDDGDRWGSEAIEPTIKKEKPKEEQSKQAPKPKSPVKEEKKKSKWWIIAIIVLVVLCVCVCVTIVLLISSGVTLFGNSDWSNQFDWSIFENLP